MPVRKHHRDGDAVHAQRKGDAQGVQPLELPHKLVPGRVLVVSQEYVGGRTPPGEPGTPPPTTTRMAWRLSGGKRAIASPHAKGIATSANRTYESSASKVIPTSRSRRYMRQRQPPYQGYHHHANAHPKRVVVHLARLYSTAAAIPTGTRSAP